MKRSFFALAISVLACFATLTLQGQTFLKDECNPGQDFGGLVSAGNPDNLSVGTLTGANPVVWFEGCMTPSEPDYNDMFTIQVPAGYELTAIQFGKIDAFFPDLTEVNFALWYGADCQPLGSPNVDANGFGQRSEDEPWTENLIAGVAPLGAGDYSMRIDMNSWPSSTLYRLYFTFSCEDGEAPEFTTAAGALDASLNCANAAGLAAALALEPEGEDNSGSVELELTSDETAEEAGCPNTYTRVRTWMLTDGCGNTDSYTQTIEVYDNTPPTFPQIAGVLDVVLNCGDEAGLANALAAAPIALDACGDVELILISDTTTPDPDCPNAYNRGRTWRAVDACGNQSLAVFNQSIQVQDNTPPVAVAINGEIAIAVAEGYELTPEDVLDLDATMDACGEVKISMNPAVLGCELLGQLVPVTVTVTDACSNATQVVAMIEVTEDTGIKAPWDNDNIGNTANGSATHSPCQGTYNVVSSGFSMSNSDVSHFVYVDLCGDGEIIARVASVNPAGGWGGVMIRESLQAGARKVALKTGLNNTIRREIRANANMPFQMQQSAVPPGPVWFRIVRTVNTFNLYTSPNGSQWQFAGSAQINMGNCILMGIYSESINNNTAITSIFDNVSVSGGIQPLVEGIDPDGLIEFAQTEQLSPAPLIYPNPGSGDFQVDLSAYGTSKAMMEVCDLNGHRLLSRQLTAGRTPEALSLEHYPAGMYLVRLQPEGGNPHVLKLFLE